MKGQNLTQQKLKKKTLDKFLLFAISFSLIKIFISKINNKVIRIQRIL